jgi:hypothetical protein
MSLIDLDVAFGGKPAPAAAADPFAAFAAPSAAQAGSAQMAAAINAAAATRNYAVKPRLGNICRISSLPLIFVVNIIFYRVQDCACSSRSACYPGQG